MIVELLLLFDEATMQHLLSVHSKRGVHRWPQSFGGCHDDSRSHSANILCMTLVYHTHTELVVAIIAKCTQIIALAHLCRKTQQ